MTRLGKVLLAATLLATLTGAASADILSAFSRKAPATGTGKTFAFVALNDGGSFTVGFNAAAGTTVAVTYSAECQRTGNKGHVALQIFVDDKLANPQVGKDYGFCSSNGPTGVSRTVFVVTAGADPNREVRVKAAALGGATGWSLDDSALIIEN